MSNNVALILPDGTKIYEDSRVEKPAAQVAAGLSREITSGRAAAASLNKIHRKLGDLPDTPDKLNPVCAVITYRAIGLSTQDIAVALHTTIDNIERLMNLDVYKQIADMFDKTVFEDARQNAKHIISRAADFAAQKIVDHVSDDDPNISIIAGREVLRIAGVSTDEDRAKTLGGLKIVIEKNDNKGSDTVTVTLGDGNG